MVDRLIVDLSYITSLQSVSKIKHGHDPFAALIV